MNDKATLPANTVETPWNRFKRIVTAPHWCDGDPLEWEVPGGIGIAAFARDGKVGHFNLAWWLLSRKKPPMSEQAYKDCPITWVILHAAQLKVGPYTLTDMACWMTQYEWQQWLLSYRTAQFAERLEAHGVTYVTLLSKIDNGVKRP